MYTRERAASTSAGAATEVGEHRASSMTNQASAGESGDSASLRDTLPACPRSRAKARTIRIPPERANPSSFELLLRNFPAPALEPNTQATKTDHQIEEN